MTRTVISLVLGLALALSPLIADDGFQFSAGISLGADSIPKADGTSETWNVLGFQPELAFGKIGIGLDLTMRFQIMPDVDTGFAVYPGDWVPDYQGNGRSLLDIYLPKIQYVRYGLRGDPLYVKLGSIEDFTIGNGFIMGNYANTRFLPSQRIFGLSLQLDGQLFDFPWVGLEVLTGNLARFDVVGARLYARPLWGTDLPIIKSMQVGGSFVTDRDPALHRGDLSNLDPVDVFGADVVVPIIGGQVFPLAVFTELAFQPHQRYGWMLGAGGRLLQFITYGAQLRLLGPGFIPGYFDPNYDLFRADKAQIMASAPDAADKAFAGWFASLGTSLFGDAISFSVSLEGPFAAKPASPDPNPAFYPHLRAVAGLAEGLIGGFSFNFAYDKYFLGKDQGFFDDLVDPNDTVITAAVNYSTGGAMFTLLYNLTYNPESPRNFDITSSLSTSIRF